jgi:hypothetical protein
VFFDLVKIRRLVEEATNLAVRAANGTTSSSLYNASHAGGGLFGGGSAAALGLGLGGNGGTAKLSRERKHRMRELATQKLSEAYYLDEIAASVATMQSASSLEDVAKLVLQKNAADVDAKYVHFFHEKIPSRMLAECTSLTPLNEVIQERPTVGAPWRTRAVTRIFKEDYAGAVKDLTEALTVCRVNAAQHTAGQNQMIKHSPQVEPDMDEANRPSSLEPQLLFHRANAYLTLAVNHVNKAFDSPNGKVVNGANHSEQQSMSEAAEVEVDKVQAEARKLVKTYAKRALRDYVSMLSHFDYSPGLPYAATEEFFHRFAEAANGKHRSRNLPTNRLLEMSGNSNLSNGSFSNSFSTSDSEDESLSHSQEVKVPLSSLQSMPVPKVYQLSELFSSSPPSDLPPYPVISQELVLSSKAGQKPIPDLGCHEVVTYHPLLTDALHSLLLCHSLIQTSPKEHLRHAHMVARLARVCDGYPIFLAARSPARADWIEIIRRSNNWLNLHQSWEALCAPAPLAGHSTTAKKETKAEIDKRIRQEAIQEALADERVVDEATFQASVETRTKLAEERMREDAGETEGPKRWAQSDGKEYPISTERATAVSRWIKEAPKGVEGTGNATKKRKGKKGTKKHTDAGDFEDLADGLAKAHVDSSNEQIDA